MNRWKAFGSFVSAHMHIIVPLCVLTGILLPDVFSPLSSITTLLFAFVTFQGSLNNTFGQLVETIRRPKPLLTTLFLSLVAMPALAYLVGMLFFGHSTNIVTGIVLEYCVPIGVSSFMWVELNHGNTSLTLTCILISTLLAPFTIPLTLKILMGSSVQVDAVDMILDMILMIGLPALAGVLVNELTHGWGSRELSPAIAPASRFCTLLVITTNATNISGYVRNMTMEHLEVAVFICLFASLGYLLGILAAVLQRQPAENLVSMGFGSGMRNISTGTVIASRYFPEETVFPVVIGTMFQHVLAAIFARFMRALISRRQPDEASPN